MSGHPPDVSERLASADLRAAWERYGTEWVAWARNPDDSYWQWHRDSFLELVPPPGRRTLDLGCGEGRLTRHLAELGHMVAGIDGSETIIAAARTASPGLELQLADAAALPFEDGAFDLAVAFMTLMDIDDLDGAVHEAARVLEPGGRLCLAIVHPLNSAGAFATKDPLSPYVIDGSYLAGSFYADRFERDGYRMTFVSAHRSLEQYAEALAGAGFAIERLREPAVPERAIGHESTRRWQRLPLFLQVRAVKLAPR